MSIRFLISALLLFPLLIACSGNSRDTNILVDLNSTTASPIYVYQLPDMTNVVDSAHAFDGQYRLSSRDWQPGLYRFFVDSANSLDVIIRDARALAICARINHFDEATSNNKECQLLWQVEALQHELDSIHSDSLFVSMRSRADQLLAQAEGSIVTIPVLNLSLNGRYLYNIISDHNIFDQASLKLTQSYPDNVEVQRLASLVNKARVTSRFISKFAKGQPAPSFSINLRNGQSLSSDYFGGSPYVFHFTTDTTRSAESHWQTVALNRFNNYRVVANIPNSFQHIGNVNVFEGSVDANSAAQFAPFQPVTIFVNADGRITDINYTAK
ncbi:MAG: hypothetical protein MJZ15_07100 [Bacteroidales bacterium]|nr:hypothetical protein [Bacteroidales bacterium]